MESTKQPNYTVPVWNCDGSGAICGWNIRYVEAQEFINKILENRRRIILLNALVAPRETPMFMLYQQIPNNIAIEILKRVEEIESYIGHESTVNILKQLSGREIPYNRGLYQPKKDDIAIIVRLARARPQGDVKDISPNDLEFGILWYL